jgi:hypothetical protein
MVQPTVARGLNRHVGARHGQIEPQFNDIGLIRFVQPAQTFVEAM